MIYYTDEARKTAIENIKKLMPIVANIPGDVLSFTTASDINYYLSSFAEAIITEQYNIDRERRKRKRRGE